MAPCRAASAFGDEEEEEDEEEDDNCTPGWQANECLNDGTVTYARGCSSCDDCEMYDYTAATGGRATCDPTTNTMSYDNGGNDIDVRPFWSGCWYDDCDDDEGSDPTSVESPFLVTGDLTFEGMTYEAARDNTDVFVAAVADLCGVAASAVTVEISEARRRRRLAEGIVVTYTVGVATANEAQTVTSAISSSSTADVDAAISKAATDAGVDDDFDGVTTTNVGTPTTTASDDGGSSGGKDDGPGAASAATIIAVAAAMCAVLIGVVGFLYWKMQQVQGRPVRPVGQAIAVEMATYGQTTAAPSYVLKAASAPPGRSFCVDCGAAIQGRFCGACGRNQPAVAQPASAPPFVAPTPNLFRRQPMDNTQGAPHSLPVEIISAAGQGRPVPQGSVVQGSVVPGSVVQGSAVQESAEQGYI